MLCAARMELSRNSKGCTCTKQNFLWCVLQNICMNNNFPRESMFYENAISDILNV